MPSARSSSAAARRHSQASTSAETSSRPAHRVPRPRRVPLRSSVVRVRWERVGRVALLVVLAAVVVLYAEHTLSYLHTHAQASRENAIVSRLTRENRALQARRTSLSDPGTIISRARALGMTRPGEQPYDITGQAGGG
jgi:cell division protein FtsB